jgi:hypothetical protein
LEEEKRRRIRQEGIEQEETRLGRGQEERGQDKRGYDMVGGGKKGGVKTEEEVEEGGGQVIGTGGRQGRG